MKLRARVVLIIAAAFALLQVSAMAADDELVNTLGLRIGYENNKNSENDLGEAPVVSVTYTRAIKDWRIWGSLGYGAGWDVYEKSLIEAEIAGGKKIVFPDMYIETICTFGAGLKMFHLSQDEKFIVDYTLISPELVARGEFPLTVTGMASIFDLTIYPLAFFTRGEGYSVSKGTYGDSESGITYGFKGEAAIKWDIKQFTVQAGVRYVYIGSAGLKDFYSGDEFLGPFIEGGWRF